MCGIPRNTQKFCCLLCGDSVWSWIKKNPPQDQLRRVKPTLGRGEVPVRASHPVSRGSTPRRSIYFRAVIGLTPGLSSTRYGGRFPNRPLIWATKVPTPDCYPRVAEFDSPVAQLSIDYHIVTDFTSVMFLFLSLSLPIVLSQAPSGGSSILLSSLQTRFLIRSQRLPDSFDS